MKIETLSVFPRCYDSVMNESIMRIAQERASLISKRTTCVSGRMISIVPPTMSLMAVVRAL